jgi:hypothetical protein
MLHPRVHQLVLEEGSSPTNDLLSRHHRRHHRLHILVRLPPTPQRDLLARALLQAPHASSVVRLVTMLMFVRRGTPTHRLVVILRASRHRLQTATMVIASMLKLLRIVLTSSLVRSLLIQCQLLCFLILELHIHSYLFVMFMQIVYLTLPYVDL